MAEPLKPFANTPGRDTGRDQPGFDIARCYYEQRFRIAEDAATLRQLMAAVDCANDLAPAQWAQWYGIALGFAPDLVLELGRGRGNSTALFGQAAWRLGHTKVISLCQSSDWMSAVAPRVAASVDPRWFANIDPRLTDILAAEYAPIIADHRRVLVLWDAHGFEIAEVVLGDILPSLVDRHHLILMHDISDNRYASVRRSYEEQPLWKGSKWQRRSGAWNSRVNIGWMNSIQDQVIALADFSARNDVEVGSADHEFARFFADDAGRTEEMRTLLGDQFFSVVGHWAFLSLNGKQGPFHFPAVSRRVFTEQCALVTNQLRRLPATIVTDAKPWAYASTLTWRPASNPPPNAQACISARLRVEGGAIGVGLLSQDEKEFVEYQVVSSAAEAVRVLLPVADLTQHGPLVIYTWDAPVSARVHIDDLSLVW